MRKDKPICGIYKITSPSGRIYIGQSIDIVDRWCHYKRRGAPSQVKLHRSFIKYGPHNHKFEILHQCTKEELNALEIYYVNLFQSKDKENGLNVRDGGGNRALHSEDSKKLIGDRHRNKFVSKETRIKISESKKGCKAWNKGVPFSEETKLKMNQWRIGGKLTEEHKRKISMSNASGKLILNLETGIYYNSIPDAAKSIGVSRYCLGQRLLGRSKKKTSFIYA